MQPDVGGTPPACHRGRPTDEADGGRDGADSEPDGHEEDRDDRHDRGRDREEPPDEDTTDEEESDRVQLEADGEPLDGEPPDGDTPDGDMTDEDTPDGDMTDGDTPHEDTTDEEEPGRVRLEAEAAEGEEPDPYDEPDSASRSEATSPPVASTADPETVPAIPTGPTGALTTADDAAKEVAAAPDAAADALPRASSGVPEPNDRAVWGLGAALGPVSAPVVLPLVVALLVAMVLVVQGIRHQSPVEGSPPAGRRGRRFE